MKYILIADSGSTKSDWALIDEKGKEVRSFTIDGINALTAKETDLNKAFQQTVLEIGTDIIPDEIHYYGAGCATDAICQKVSEALDSVYPQSIKNVSTDLLGAARSLLGSNPGIACILGTGSNSCRYDGTGIVSNVPSLGYILGDEGSGAALGKRLISDAFKGKLPEQIKEALMQKCGLTLGDILDKVYRNPTPSKFLASLVPFISSHIWNPYIYAMVRKEFDMFLDRNISPYEDSRSVPISFTGSIAYHFSDILREAATDEGYKVGMITSKPIDGLIEYHSQKS